MAPGSTARSASTRRSRATQENAQVAALPGGNFVVVFQSDTSGSAGDGSNDGVFQQVVGDPAEIALSLPPVQSGFEGTVTFAESAANAGVRLTPAGAVQLSDPDSTDFDGGLLRVSRSAADPDGDDFLPPDDNSQDNLFFSADGTGVSVSGVDVMVGGILVGTLTSDGAAGSDLIVSLNAAADAAAVQALISALSYRNDSDNPQGERTYRLTVEDGQGGVSDPGELEIVVTQEAEPGGSQPVGAELQVNSFEADAQNDAQVATLADGGWVVVWTSTGQDGSGEGVYLQRFTADGDRAGPETPVNTDQVGDQFDPVVTGLSDGGWVVIWEQANVLQGQRFDNAGEPAGGVFTVNTNAGTLGEPSVSAFSAADGGGFVVTYTTNGSPDDTSSDGVVSAATIPAASRWTPRNGWPTRRRSPTRTFPTSRSWRTAASWSPGRRTPRARRATGIAMGSSPVSSTPMAARRRASSK